MCRIFIILSLLLWTTISVFANCPDSTLVLSNQAQIDSFKLVYPECTEIHGDVFIGLTGFNAISDITNLDGLSNITSILGNLELKQNDLLKDLSGFNLQSLTGDLTLDRNDGLLNATGLEGLTRIGGTLDIDANANEFQSTGLHNVKVIGGNLNINFQRNSVFIGLELDSIIGNLSIYQNSLMTSLSGLSGLDYLGGKLSINRTGVSSVSGLSNLTRLGGLDINNNYSAINLSGLSNVEVIDGDFRIVDMEKSVSISSLSSLHTITGDWYLSHIWYLDISDIPALRRIEGSLIFDSNNLTEDIKGIRTLEYIGGNLSIQNTAFLDSIEEFESLDTINGSLMFRDLIYEMKTFDVFNTLKYIGGDLYFEGNYDMEQINGFTSLHTIGGNYRLEANEELVSIQWPENLTKLGGVNIYYNEKLESIPEFTTGAIGGGDIIFIGNKLLLSNIDFSEVDTVVGSIIIQNNAQMNRPSFANVSYVGGDIDINQGSGNLDFDQLTYLGGSLRLSSMSDLTNIDWLANINTIPGDLELRYLYDMTSSAGLANLDSIYGELDLYYLRTLELLQIQQLEYIGKSLNLTFMDGLTNLDDFSNLKVVKERINISYNDELLNVSGLEQIIADSINLVWGDEVRILKNSKLRNCDVRFLCQILEDADKSADIGENAPGCNSTGEIECLEYGVSGIVFYDNNQNGIQDENDFGIKNMPIKVGVNEEVIYTNEIGKYLYKAEEAEQYTIVIDQDESEWELTTTDDELTPIFYEGLSSNANNHFGLYPKYQRHDLSVDFTSGPTRCNVRGIYKLILRNTGNQIETGNIILERDDRVGTYTYSESPYTQGNTLTWDFDTLYPQQTKCIDMVFYSPSEEFTGDQMEFLASVERDSSGIFIPMDSMSYHPIVLCSYDPNDKLVSPPGIKEENYTLKEDELKYTVRFQNTGNAPAIDVRVLDTLDANLDLSTFEVLGSSASVHTTLRGNVVDFFFKDIWLPDSLSNPLESNGFISYKVRVKEGLEDFEQVTNSAGIYFDFNPPIITNTTFNTMMDEICDSKYTVIDTTICGYEDYLGYTTSQIILDTIALSITCDSFITHNLTVKSFSENEYDRNACKGTEVWTSGGYILAEESGIYRDTTFHWGDSTCIRTIDIMHLQVYETSITSQDTIVCPGVTVYNYSEPGDHIVSMYNFLTTCYDTIHLNILNYEDSNALCYDGDGDGFVLAEDCNDDNPDSYPFALEICDQEDNDCDGQIDEFLAQSTYFLDQDGDGYGIPEVSIQDCSIPIGYSLNSTDCDDENPDINPAQADIFDNGVDENCDGVDSSIYDIFPKADISDLRSVDSLGVYIYEGDRVTVSGVVHSINFLSPNDLLFNIIDENRNGIFVYDQGIWSNYTPSIGDVIEVHGLINGYRGLLEIQTSEITQLGESGQLFSPRVVDNIGEDTEADIIRLSSVSLVNPASWLGNGSSFNVIFTDGNTNHTIRIHKGTYWSNQPAPMGLVNVVGIGSQYDTQSPYLDGYQLFPRFDADIFSITSSKDDLLESKYCLLSPNPSQGMFTVTSNIDIKHIAIFDVTGRLINDEFYNQSKSIDIEIDDKGLYFVKLTMNNNQHEVQKVLID